MKPQVTTPLPASAMPPTRAEATAAPEGPDAQSDSSGFRDLLEQDKRAETPGRESNPPPAGRNGQYETVPRQGSRPGTKSPKPSSHVRHAVEKAATPASELQMRDWGTPRNGMTGENRGEIADEAVMSVELVEEWVKAGDGDKPPIPGQAGAVPQAPASAAFVPITSIPAGTPLAGASPGATRKGAAQKNATSAVMMPFNMDRPENEAPDQEGLLRQALKAPGNVSAQGGSEMAGASGQHARKAGAEHIREHSTALFRMPGWHALKAEVAESGEQRHFAPAMPSLPLSFTGVLSQSASDDASIATQVLEGLEPALSHAPGTSQSHRPAVLTVRTLEIRLHPEHLGAIAAHIERRGDTLEVTLRASRRDVAEELEKTAHHLAERLQAAAGHATRVQLHVAVLPPGAAAEARQADAQGQFQQQGAFAQPHAGPDGGEARQQPGGQHHAQQGHKATDIHAGDDNGAGDGLAGGRAAHGLYL